MITIFNQTKTPWLLETENEKVLSFRKSQKYIKDNTERLSYIKVNGDISLINDMEGLNNKLSTMSGMLGPETLSNVFTNLSFKRKNFKPFIVNCNENKKDIVLLSFDIFRSKIIKTTGSGFFLLEGIIKSNEYSLILGFNSPKATFTIDIYNIPKKQILTYTFKKIDDRIVAEINVDQNIDLDIATLAYKVKPTRPSRSTYYILVSEYDEKIFDKFYNYSEDSKRMQKVVIHSANGSVQKAITSLKEERVTAVTFFINEEKKSDKFYSMMISKLIDNFTIVYQLSNLGIKKIKLF